MLQTDCDYSQLLSTSVPVGEHDFFAAIFDIVSVHPLLPTAPLLHQCGQTGSLTAYRTRTVDCCIIAQLLVYLNLLFSCTIFRESGNIRFSIQVRAKLSRNVLGIFAGSLTQPTAQTIRINRSAPPSAPSAPPHECIRRREAFEKDGFAVVRGFSSAEECTGKPCRGVLLTDTVTLPCTLVFK